MNIRQLEPNDAEAYYSLRLEVLQNHPDSFGSSFEEEITQTAQKYQGTYYDEEYMVLFL